MSHQGAQQKLLVALDEIKEARVAATALPEQQIELDKISKHLGAVFLAAYRLRQAGGSAHLFERSRRERHGGAQGGRCLTSLPCARPRDDPSLLERLPQTQSTSMNLNAPQSGSMHLNAAQSRSIHPHEWPLCAPPPNL